MLYPYSYTVMPFREDHWPQMLSLTAITTQMVLPMVSIQKLRQQIKAPISLALAKRITKEWPLTQKTQLKIIPLSCSELPKLHLHKDFHLNRNTALFTYSWLSPLNKIITSG